MEGKAERGGQGQTEVNRAIEGQAGQGQTEVDREMERQAERDG